MPKKKSILDPVAPKEIIPNESAFTTLQKHLDDLHLATIKYSERMTRSEKHPGGIACEIRMAVNEAVKLAIRIKSYRGSSDREADLRRVSEIMKYIRHELHMAYKAKLINAATHPNCNCYRPSYALPTQTRG